MTDHHLTMTPSGAVTPRQEPVVTVAAWHLSNDDAGTFSGMLG